MRWSFSRRASQGPGFWSLSPGVAQTIGDFGEGWVGGDERFEVGDREVLGDGEGEEVDEFAGGGTGDPCPEDPAAAVGDDLGEP